MSALKHLYPSIEPFDSFELDVGEGHVLYVEQCGSPSGVPVIVLHGGPGGGCSPFMRRFFNPEIYRIVLFDQRGCGRSIPHASVENNTTWIPRYFPLIIKCQRTPFYILLSQHYLCL